MVNSKSAYHFSQRLRNTSPKSCHTLFFVEVFYITNYTDIRHSFQVRIEGLNSFSKGRAKKNLVLDATHFTL